jgi:hemerythrin superfamily protein
MTTETDAIDLLLHDHRAIDRLAEQLDATDDVAEIARLLDRIVVELTAHEAAEHEVIFPAFRATLGRADDETIERRMGEHEELNDVLAEMQALEPDCFGFVKRASALLLDVRGHFLREEESVFVRMRDSMSDEELADLGSRALAVKQRAAAQPGDPTPLAADR